MLLLVMSVGMISYTIVESQWKEMKMNILEISNELLLSVLLMLLLCNQMIAEVDRS